MDCDYPGKNAFQKKNKKTLSYMNGKDSDVFGNCSRFIFCLFYIFIFFFSKKHNGNSRDVTLPHILHWSAPTLPSLPRSSSRR